MYCKCKTQTQFERLNMKKKNKISQIVKLVYVEMIVFGNNELNKIYHQYILIIYQQ